MFLLTCISQGGTIFLETISAVTLSQCGNSYTRRIRHLLHGAPSYQEKLPAASNANITMWAVPDDVTVDLSQFYLALMAKDDSGMPLLSVVIFYSIRLDIFWCLTLCRKTSRTCV